MYWFLSHSYHTIKKKNTARRVSRVQVGVNERTPPACYQFHFNEVFYFTMQTSTMLYNYTPLALLSTYLLKSLMRVTAQKVSIGKTWKICIRKQVK